MDEWALALQSAFVDFVWRLMLGIGALAAVVIGAIMWVTRNRD